VRFGAVTRTNSSSPERMLESFADARGRFSGVAQANKIEKEAPARKKAFILLKLELTSPV
ncbi:MAG: hypothetical protein EBX52_11360, partial [Proteobacteria bacterium]|nr:hypothetical protein [Pseudomonadota bacterium]